MNYTIISLVKANGSRSISERANGLQQEGDMRGLMAIMITMEGK